MIGKKGGSLKFFKFLSFLYKIYFWEKTSESNIWFSHFEFNVLEGDMVSFADAFLFWAGEGEAKFWITLYSKRMALN